MLVFSPPVKACDFFGFVEYAFSETSRCTGQATKSIDEENYFVQEGDRDTRLDLIADWAETVFFCSSALEVNFRPNISHRPG